MYTDPNTGLPLSQELPSPENALNVQAEHDRAIWSIQQRYMDQAMAKLRGGTMYQQGALGLLNSYRPGGSAALEAGIYNQVAGGLRSEAGGLFQRAGMTQPLDLMGKYRERREDEAIRRLEKQQKREFYASLISSGAQVIAAFAGGMRGAGGGATNQQALRTGIGSILNGGGSQDASTGTTTYQQSGQYLASGPQTQSSQQVQGPSSEYVASLNAPVEGQGSAASVLGPGQPPSQQQQGSPFQAPQQQQPQQTSPYTAPDPSLTQRQPGQPGVGAPGTGQGDQMAGGGSPGQGGGAQPFTGGPGGGGGMVPGMDGNFSPDSFAAAAAGNQYQSPLEPLTRVALSDFVADLYETDPFYQSLPMVINRAWAQRIGATA